MIESPFLELLLKLSASRLTEMLTQTDERIGKLKFEREYIVQALAEKKGSSHAPGRQTVSRGVDRSGANPRRGITTERREAILNIMETNGEAVWIPSAIRDQLAAQGMRATTPAVRATMKRMLEDGELARPGEGEHGFKLASRNGSSAESNAGPTENESTEPPFTTTGSQEGT